MSEIIPIGPYHPLQEEPEFFRLHVEGETVTKLDIELGYNHRGIEKLAEAKSWDQVVFLPPFSPDQAFLPGLSGCPPGPYRSRRRRGSW